MNDRSQDDGLGLPLYEYSALSDPGIDIRLLTLLPGDFYSPLRLSIRHVSLPESNRPQPVKRIGEPDPEGGDLQALRETLPPEWETHRSRGGRFFFLKRHGENFTTSWTHPDPSIDVSAYAPEPSTTSQPKLEYEALSYVWGPEGSEMLVSVIEDDYSAGKGSSPSIRGIFVRPNLASALKYLRFPDCARTLWIDALCIDQSNIQERDKQVRRMSDIFTRASRVVMWLGSEDNESTEALSTLDHIGKEVVWAPEVSWFFPSPGLEGIPLEKRMKAVFSIETWLCICTLFERSWFSRRWIVQERQLASPSSVMQCGSYVISWERFCTAAAFLTFNPTLPWPLRNVRERLKITSFGLQALSLTEILSQIHNTHCINPRDKIIGILGITTEPFRLLFQPQYSLSVEEVYRNAVIADIQWSNKVHLLKLCELASRQINGPTWVPDFTAETLHGWGLVFQFSSGFSAASAVYSNANILTVKGFEGGVVKLISSPCPNDMRSSLAMLREWIWNDLVKELDVKSERFLHTLIRTLCCGVDKAVGSVQPTLEQYKRTILSINSLGLEVDREECGNQLSELHLYQLAGKLEGRSFFLTDNGIIGLCPTGTLKGDFLCVLLGLDAPLMLRPVNECSHYQVVGESFALALEDMKSFLPPLPKGWRVEVDARGCTSVYVNDKTGTRTLCDPRLGTLEGWTLLETRPVGIESGVAVNFRNDETGEIINYDPRLTADALEKRGVFVQSFCLI